MVDNLKVIEKSLVPLTTLSEYSDAAAKVTNTGRIDPLELTYRLMEIQRGAEDHLSKLKDPILCELSAQARGGSGEDPRGGGDATPLAVLPLERA